MKLILMFTNDGRLILLPLKQLGCVRFVWFHCFLKNVGLSCFVEGIRLLWVFWFALPFQHILYLAVAFGMIETPPCKPQFRVDVSSGCQLPNVTRHVLPVHRFPFAETGSLHNLSGVVMRDTQHSVPRGASLYERMTMSARASVLKNRAWRGSGLRQRNVETQLFL